MKIAYLIIGMFLVLLLVCCDDSGSKTKYVYVVEDPEIHTNVYAKNGDFIGEAINLKGDTVTVLNDKGFMFSLFYDGSLVYTPMYFESEDWNWETGDVYIDSECSGLQYYNEVYISYTTAIALYKLYLDGNGDPVYSNDTPYQSSSYYKGTLSDSGTLDCAIRITNASWAETGLKNNYGDLTVKVE